MGCGPVSRRHLGHHRGPGGEDGGDRLVSVIGVLADLRPAAVPGCPVSARTGGVTRGDPDAAPGSDNRRDEPGASASGPGHTASTPRSTSLRCAGGPALAGSGAMIALADAGRRLPAAARTLGHELAEAVRVLPRLVAYLEAEPPPPPCRGAGLGPAAPRRPGHERRATADDRRPRLRPLPIRHRSPHRSAAPRLDPAPPPLAPAVHLLPRRHRHADAERPVPQLADASGHATSP